LVSPNTILSARFNSFHPNIIPFSLSMPKYLAQTPRFFSPMSQRTSWLTVDLGDIDSVTALLVFALGEVAIEGSRGQPIEEEGGRPSGVRGGSITRPPGLALFNEARKRIGFVLTEGELENVQIFSLAA
jgi:hypothetical protein